MSEGEGKQEFRPMPLKKSTFSVASNRPYISMFRVSFKTKERSLFYKEEGSDSLNLVNKVSRDR